ncbi:MAG: protein translocase subunit SecD [Chloroflexota bacterium]|nr:protein translocase subunit SecD [Chloroflexota bacterium]
MRERNLSFLVGIVILTLVAGWIAWPTNPGIHLRVGSFAFDREIRLQQDLDLQGGTQVLLQVDVPEGEAVDAETLLQAKTIVENRANSLGGVDPVVQLQGDRRIIVELPEVKDQDLIISTLRGTGLLEFVDAGYTYLEPGTVIKTSYGGVSDFDEELTTPTPTVTEEPTLQATETITADATSAVETTPAPGETPPAEASPTPLPTPVPAEPVYTTILTGEHLKAGQTRVYVDSSQDIAQTTVDIEFNEEGTPIFVQFNQSHDGQFLAIVLDKVVVSCPRTSKDLSIGRVAIPVPLSEAGAQGLVTQIRHGPLPIPLRVEVTRAIGPALGQESVRMSLIAGGIGLLTVLLFIAINYRLPGFLIDLSLVVYALLNLAVFKLLPVTLTLPGITGFLLSTVMAVDAGVLILERVKEELRAERTLTAAVSGGLSHARTATRDSQLVTLLVGAGLWLVGQSFGAGIVSEFAVTLFIGTIINVFTVTVVIRTFVASVFDLAGEALRDRKWLLGV